MTKNSKGRFGINYRRSAIDCRESRVRVVDKLIFLDDSFLLHSETRYSAFRGDRNFSFIITQMLLARPLKRNNAKTEKEKIERRYELMESDRIEINRSGITLSETKRFICKLIRFISCHSISNVSHALHFEFLR